MILACQKIEKAFGGKSVLNNVNFLINEGEKAAVIGINGAGKTTLFKIITGEYEADNGEDIFQKGSTYGYLSQVIDVSSHRSIYEEMLDAKKEIEKTLDMINQAFVTLLNNLFRDAAFDASADAQVLQTMLAREGLTEYQVFRNAKLQTYLAHLILKQISKRLDNLLKIYIVRQSAYIMMRLNHSRLAAQARFYHIWINRSLYQEVHRTDFLGFFFKYTNKFFSDYFPLLLRILNPGQLFVIAFLGIDTDKIQVIITSGTEYGLYFITFIFSQQTVIHKYTGQLFSNGF